MLPRRFKGAWALAKPTPSTPFPTQQRAAGAFPVPPKDTLAHGAALKSVYASRENAVLDF